MLMLRLTVVLLCCCWVLFFSPASGQMGSQVFSRGHGAERIKVLFTPTICKLRCAQGRCTNYCERGNITTLYNSQQDGPNTQPRQGSGFRVFLCPLLCKNGGVCIQKDRCLCPPNFTGKFCHIPVTASSTNDIEKPPPSPSASANQRLTHSEYILPLQTPQQSHSSGPSLVKVRVQHPPEASVKIHQVLKVGYGPTVREHSETVTWSAGLSRARTSQLPGERAEAPPPQIQAQTIRGDATYTETSGFKYCFREVRNGQCSSPLPGLRSLETCCRGVGMAWGINECTLCPNRSAQKVISEEKDQCFRILNQGSCSLPILKNITKQICCCSRVGKAWGKKCEGCPYFGSVAFKEICPAGPGYYYSASAIKFNQRLAEQHGTGGPILVSQTSTTDTRPQTPTNTQTKPQTPTNTQTRVQTPTSPQTRPQTPTSSQTITIQRPASSQITNVQLPARTGSVSTQSRPQPPVQEPSGTRPGSTVTAQPPRGQIPTVVRAQTSRPSVSRQPASPIKPLPVPATPRPPPSRPGPRVCETQPQICGEGRCVDLPGGRHICFCNPGYQPNALQTQCQDVNECSQSPRPCSPGQCENTPGSYRCACPTGYQTNSQQSQCLDIDECRQIPNICGNGRCENTPGSYRCLCRTGYKLQGNVCTDIDECEDPLRCPGQECVNSQGSYRCVSCRPGFGLLNGRCSDIDECRQSPSPCSNGRCENIPGSYRCVCRTGYRLQGNTCTDVNECEDPLRCPGQECVNTLGSYRCVSCRPGFSPLNGQCSDIDECQQNPSPCSNGRCENTPGSFRCVCNAGYRLQGNTCIDVNECEDPTRCPGQECVNSQGSYRCMSCKNGFSLLNGQCKDIDECRQTPGPCDNGRCENTPGSYNCVCRPGFRLEDNRCMDVNECENELQCPGKECVNSVGSFKCVSCALGFDVQNGQCQDVDECRQIPDPCPNGSCENIPGSYRCLCRTGFRLEGKTCKDIDECERPQMCSPQSVCVNTDGSYRCDCKPGYRSAGAGRQCRDINECLEGDFCFPKGECVNTEGSYKCDCALGYQANANGTACMDVDECGRTGVCQDGRCVNTEGSYLCHCQTGFAANPEKTACLDVDECVDTAGVVCGSQRCENTIGSFRCVTSCDPGYSITATGECVDINECANKTVCGENAICQNLIGTYQCMCDQGYEATGDGRVCVDINECVIMPDVCGTARCENVEGTFMCVCPSEDQEFDPRMVQCVSSAGTPVGPVFSGSSSTHSLSSSTGLEHVAGGGRAVVPVPQAPPGERRECYQLMEESRSCSLLALNTSLQECCCTVGQAWGIRCVYDVCPASGTAEFQTLCPSGRGYVTTTDQDFGYNDVDECKLFTTAVCKNGVCVNNIPGYSCYCPSGYHYDAALLECIDTDECDTEDMCMGGRCINTVGSYYCYCEPPLVLDNTQSSCVNSTGLTVDEQLSFCWQHVSTDLICLNPLLGGQVTFPECCCLHGEGWGLECALCPARDSEEFGILCRDISPPSPPLPYPGRFGSGPRRGGSSPLPYRPDLSEPLPGGPDDYPTDYDDYSPLGGADRRSGLRGRPPSSYGLPDSSYSRLGPGPGRYYDGEDYEPAPGPPFRVPDPRSERAFGARPPPPVPEGRPLRLAPLPENSPYREDEEEEEPWRAPPPFPPFPDRRTVGEVPRHLYERRYEPYSSLSAEECGILQGCENGRCIRVTEGYTCDCYDGYQLDVTTMTCIDVDECEEMDVPDCVNGQCVNTEGSYHCVCLRGFVMSRRPNHCIPA
ncbi:latent-transforming growth factor beta-binding protein 4 [Chanos chanos]|uniref:Latent-transforming growth factor beta-binding protein 1 n=1 Tax=Chanos chanos TaxID=29144 RepID=A0A6J2UPQ2_CHACN|nr:latent-transforming growth factor beta-binding protein 4-like [Chanos chanos]